MAPSMSPTDPTAQTRNPHHGLSRAYLVSDRARWNIHEGGMEPGLRHVVGVVGVVVVVVVVVGVVVGVVVVVVGLRVIRSTAPASWSCRACRGRVAAVAVVGRYYKDHEQGKQGPFYPGPMREWFRSAYFPPDHTRVAPSFRGEVPKLATFTPISSLFAQASGRLGSLFFNVLVNEDLSHTHESTRRTVGEGSIVVMAQCVCHRRKHLSLLSPLVP